jgi:hypothetical protein
MRPPRQAVALPEAELPVAEDRACRRFDNAGGKGLPLTAKLFVKRMFFRLRP